MFGLERSLKESFEYANVQKNGSLEQKLSICEKEIEFREEKIKVDLNLKLDDLLEGLLKTERNESLGDIFRKRRKKPENNIGLDL